MSIHRCCWHLRKNPKLKPHGHVEVHEHSFTAEGKPKEPAPEQLHYMLCDQCFKQHGHNMIVWELET